MKNNKGFIEWEILLIISVLLITIGAFVVPLSLPIIGSNEGRQKGYLTAVEKSGVIFKTYSVYIKTDLSSSQEDKYCVKDKELITKIEQNIENKTPVTIKYNNDFVESMISCGHGDLSVVTEISK